MTVTRQTPLESSSSKLHVINVVDVVRSLNIHVKLAMVKGTVDKKQTLEVKVPAGIDNGQQIRLSGQGEAGKNGGPYGDCILSLELNQAKNLEEMVLLFIVMHLFPLLKQLWAIKFA